MGLLEASYHKHKFSKKEKFFFINYDKIIIIFVIHIAQFITIIYNNMQKIAKEILSLYLNISNSFTEVKTATFPNWKG